MARAAPPQLSLFGDEDAETMRARGAVATATFDEQLTELGTSLPANVALGTSSWSFPGWRGLVWGDNPLTTSRGYYSDQVLARKGLAAYAKHPLFRSVGIDRTHYAPTSTEALAAYAQEVPSEFRFLAKAHEACTLAVFPTHPRYGEYKGQRSPHFLQANYATEQVVRPFVDGLGTNAGVLLFQFAAQPLEQLGGSPRKFAEQLYRFLSGLPKLTSSSPHTPCYAVELRNSNLLTADYAAALRSAGAVHCFNVLPQMPSIPKQLAVVGMQSQTVIRWMLAAHHTYETALAAYGDFAQMIDPDPFARRQIASLVTDAVKLAHAVTVIVNNKAEGSSPLSVRELAREIIAASSDSVPF